MFIKIKSLSCHNKNIRWIISTLDMKRWGNAGFKTSGYYVRVEGTVESSSDMRFRFGDSDLVFENFDDLESAKLACYEELGYKPVTVKDMNPGDVFSVMYNNVETKCYKFAVGGCDYILVIDGQQGGKLDPHFIRDETQVLKKYKLEEVPA